MMIYKPFFAPNSDNKYTIFSCEMQIYIAENQQKTSRENREANQTFIAFTSHLQLRRQYPRGFDQG